ncbi:ATPase AAA domain-containing protein 2 [Podochytrium sp. JEL0797]|nr:ATPase AAA domain-containing protein 2 [Podochytrium sp. JEL0797]
MATSSSSHSDGSESEHFLRASKRRRPSQPTRETRHVRPRSATTSYKEFLSDDDHEEIQTRTRRQRRSAPPLDEQQPRIHEPDPIPNEPPPILQPSPFKISLKLGPQKDPPAEPQQPEFNGDSADVSIDSEAFNHHEPEPTVHHEERKESFEDDNESDPDDAAAANDDEFQYSEHDEPFSDEEEDDSLESRRHRSSGRYSSSSRHRSRYSSSSRHRAPPQSISKPSPSRYEAQDAGLVVGNHSLRVRKPPARVDEDYLLAQQIQKEYDDQQRAKASNSRAARAATRERRIWGDGGGAGGGNGGRRSRFDDDEDLGGFLGVDGNISSDEERDSNGRPRRKLRPRKEQVDYARQLHPGVSGWAGQPLEAMNQQPNGRNRGRPRYSARRDRSPEVNYRPGKFGDKDSDSDDDNKAAGRYEGGGRSGGGGNAREGGNGLDPVNIMEILRAQEQSIFKDLPEEERKEYEENARLFRPSGGKDLADTDPVSTSTITFDSIGGLESHIRSLKEMVVMPLLYPEIFSNFQITPPRGVLFHGPPGTGKTLMARALASSCSTSTQKVAFFMRKGADVLSKWVGESERQLRLLFDQAKQFQPSIIFFDEIDGLAPVRSSKQDQIHASIVSTLLALMDGLDSRGQVVVIGATNRIDAIDPALRRPGRFDRELYFPLPSEPARKKIISITTTKWTPPMPEKLLNDLAHSTRGYCGADVRALCTEAALNAVRRLYPEIYESAHKLRIEMGEVVVTAEDFAKSMKHIVPSTQRTSTVHSNPIPKHLLPLVQQPYTEILASLDVLCPLLHQVAESNVSGFMADSSPSANILHQSSTHPIHLSYSLSFQPRLLICGKPGMGQRLLGPAALERLDANKVYIQSLDLSTLLSDSSRTPDAALIQLLHEMKRHRPAVLYIPDMDLWWEALPDSAKCVFCGLLDREVGNPVMVLGTCEQEVEGVQVELRRWMEGRLGGVSGIEGWKRVVSVGCPDEDDSTALTPVPRRTPLPRAATPPPRSLTPKEVTALFDHDASLRRQLRIELRFIINDIKRNRRFNEFHRPVDRDEFPDYDSVVTRPMDLETMLWNVNDDQYAVVEEFVADFECIVDSVEEYNDFNSAIVGKAYDLRDNFMTYIQTLQRKEPKFVWELQQSALRCRLLNQQRRAAGEPLLGRERKHFRLDAERKRLKDEYLRRRAEREREWEEERARREERGRVGKVEESGVVVEVGGVRGEDGEMELESPVVALGRSVLDVSPGKKRARVIVDDDEEEEVGEVGVDAFAGKEMNGTTGLQEAGGEPPVAVEDVVMGGTEEPREADVSVAQADVCAVEDVVEPVVALPAVDVVEKVVVDVEGAGNVREAVAVVSVEAVVQNDDVSDVEAGLAGDEDLASQIFDDEMKENGDPSVSDDQLPDALDASPEEPPRPLLLDHDALRDFESDLVYKTAGRSVSDLEALAVALSGVVYRFSRDWDRGEMMRELGRVLGRAEEVWMDRGEDRR